MIQDSDIDFLFGKRRPGPVPTKSARQDQERVNKVAEAFFKTLLAACPKEQAAPVIERMAHDTLGLIALIPAHDRVGIPDGQSDLTDMEATIRLATKFPDQFKAFDLAGLKAKAMTMRKAGAS